MARQYAADDNDVLNDMEMKQFQLTEGINASMSSQRQQQEYRKVSQSSTQFQPQYVYATPPPSHSKVYIKAIHQVLLHLAIIYCLFGVTYTLFFQTNNRDCACTYSEPLGTNPNKQNTSVITDAPTSLDVTLEPTSTPSVSIINTVIADEPTPKPSGDPTINPITDVPTAKPTSPPTLDYSVYANYIGDFKMSAQNASHGNWLLCDGSFIDSKDYPELFQVIEYKFGFFSGYPSLFSLPNKTDSQDMISYFEDMDCPDGWQKFEGANGRFILSSGLYSSLSEDNRNETQQYVSGETGGEIKHKLLIDEIPTHNHIVSGQDNYAVPSGAASNEVANVENYPSIFTRTTSSSGGDGAHNNMPPYLVLNACKYTNPMANMFILASTD